MNPSSIRWHSYGSRDLKQHKSKTSQGYRDQDLGDASTSQGMLENKTGARVEDVFTVLREPSKKLCLSHSVSGPSKHIH